jgi:thiol-disulfide isomerase/thioredoxin
MPRNLPPASRPVKPERFDAEDLRMPGGASTDAWRARGSMRAMRVTTLLVAFLLVVSGMAAAAPAERPDFPEIQLEDLNGQVYQLKDFLGTVTLLNFWATWCGPCRQELPELQKIYNQLGSKGFVVLAVAVDTPREQVKPFLQRMGLTLPAMLVDKETQASLGVGRIPMSVLLDRNGKVAQIYPGYAPQMMEDVRTRAEELLAEKRASGGK